MTDRKISFQEQPDEEQPNRKVSLTQVPGPVVNDVNTLNTRANKVDYALGENSPGVDSITSQMMSGNEGILRDQIASQRMFQDQTRRRELVQEFIEQGAKVGGLSDEDVQFLKELSSSELENNRTIIEKAFAERATQQALLAGHRHLLREAQFENQEATDQTIDFFEEELAWKETFQNIAEEVNTRAEQRGIGRIVGDIAELFVPFRQGLNIGGFGTVLQGDALEEEVQRIRAMPLDERERYVRDRANWLLDQNKFDALLFLHAVGNFSNTDQAFENFSLIDLAEFTPIGIAGAFVSTSKVARLRRAMQDTNRAFNTAAPDPADILSAAGNAPDAAKLSILEGRIEPRTTRVEGVEIANIDELGKEVPSIYNPTRSFSTDMPHAARVFTNRLRNSIFSTDDVLLENRQIIDDAFNSPTSIVRNDPNVLNKIFNTAIEELQLRFPRLNDAVLDVVEAAPEGTLGRSGAVIVRVGRPDGSLFQTEGEALRAGLNDYMFNREAFTIKQQGSHHYLELTKALDETTESARDVTLSTMSQTPRNAMNAFLGFFRNPDDLVSFFERGNRNAATHLTQELREAMSSVIKHIGPEKLNKRQRKDLNRILNVGRTHMYHDANGKKRYGRFHTTQGQLEQEYLRTLSRMPTQDEVRAYFTYVQLSDLDWMLRNLGIFRDKSRLGIEHFSFKTWMNVGEDGNRIFTDLDINSFEGVRRESIPWEKDVGILVQNGTAEPIYVRSSQIPVGEREGYENQILNGSTIIEVANPTVRPFKRVVDKVEVNFVIAPHVNWKSLPFKQLPRRPGGHIDYKDGWFAKTPNVEHDDDGRIIYTGDTTLFTAVSKKQMDRYISDFNEAVKRYRPHFKDEIDNPKELAQVQAFVQEKLPMNWDEFTKLFRVDEDTGKATMNIDHELFTVRQGKNVGSTVDLPKHLNIPTLRNSTDSEFNLFAEVNKRYAGDRDALLPRLEKGSDENPIIHFDPDQLLDPLSNLNNALTELARARNLDDLKISATERYINEFGDVLEGSIEEIRRDPVNALHNMGFKRNHPDQVKVTAARNARRSLLNLLGTRSELRETIDGFTHKIMDVTLERFGQKAADGLQTIGLGAVADPLKFARSVAFHSKLGMFNPLQYILQAQSMTHVMALAGPIRGPQGVLGATFEQYLRFNNKPQTLAHFDNMATKFGWKPGEFTESHKEFRRSGLWRVEGEVAQLDDFTNPTLFNSKTGNFFLKWGTGFFREGERLVRSTAWHAAFKEFRHSKPNKTITDLDRNAILTRANDMFVNMTRASSASIQQGIFSLPTQFLSFQARLMEQMIGGRLTRAEKLKAFIAYSLMYGVPVGTAGTVMGGVVPAGEMIRTDALENGVEVNEGAMNLFFNGLPDMMLQMATGEQFNFSERFGPGGNPSFYEAWTGEKGVLELFTGASGSILGDMISHVDPIISSTLDVMSGEEGSLPLLVSDFADAAAEVSSINNVTKAMYAINSGKYITRNQIFVDEINNTQAIFSAFGLTPREVSDAFLKLGSMSQITKRQNDAKKMFIKYYRKALAAETHEEVEAFLKRAKSYVRMADVNPADNARWIRDALKGQRSLVDNINYRFSIKKAPASQQEQRLEQFIKE